MGQCSDFPEIYIQKFYTLSWLPILNLVTIICGVARLRWLKSMYEEKKESNVLRVDIALTIDFLIRRNPKRFNAQLQLLIVNFRIVLVLF